MATQTQTPSDDSSTSSLKKSQRRRSDSGVCTWQHLRALNSPPVHLKAPPHAHISSIPRTPAARLSHPDAAPSPFPSEPILANTVAQRAPAEPVTFLYLAYGSNLCAEVFNGRRGIRPLSAVNVSAPSLRLCFNLPGLPYAEPCFANTALRKLPGTPPKLPPGVPDIPDFPNPPHSRPPYYLPSSSREVARNAAGEPVWDKGLIGVVYEVTPADYATILATEGGGSSYREILVPCMPLPPTVGVPEKPPIPELPKPFIARTLFAPQLPDLPDDGDDNDKGKTDDGDSGGSGGDDPDDPTPPPKLPSWARKLLLPVCRPDPDYAQASARYLGLIADGAREHDLPGEYIAYLDALRPYAVTTWRQFVGRIMFLGFWAPIFIPIFALGRVLTDDKGKMPAWLAATMTVLFNLVWMSYDAVAKPVFGEGERTIADGEGEVAVHSGRTKATSRWRSWSREGEQAIDEEKTGLLERIYGQ